MKSECRKPFQDRGEFFWGFLGCAKHPFVHGHCYFIHVWVSIQQIISLVQRDKGLSYNSSFPGSDHNTSMVCHFRIWCCYAVWAQNWRKKTKPGPTTLKGINKCIEKEKGHKHWGFYSECRDADASTECTWRAKMRAAKGERNPRVIRWGQRVLAIFRP